MAPADIERFAKEYLRLFVEEMRLQGSTVILRGNNGVWARAAGEKDLEAPGMVPRFGYAWLPLRGESGHWEERLSLV